MRRYVNYNVNVNLMKQKLRSNNLMKQKLRSNSGQHKINFHLHSQTHPSFPTN